MPLKDILRNKIPNTLWHLIPSSFDIVGSREKAVAVIEIPDELIPYEKEIAEAIMSIHKNVRAVMRKSSERKGPFRLREHVLVIGDENTEVVHKEHGCLLKLDIRHVYFSPREATERQRVASQVKPNERVLVMFSGICPYAIAIAKKQPNIREVYAVELNPIAHNYCAENIKLNKLSGKITPILGDVREICPKLGSNFDRVVMPLPKGAHEYLDVAISCLRDGGVLHFYHWAREPDLYSEAERLIREIALKFGREFEILAKVRVLPYAPRTWKVCIDALIK